MTTDTAPASEFDKLLSEINGIATDVTKAMKDGADTAKGDKKVAEAEKEGAEGEGEVEDCDKDMTKSFEVTLADGTKLQAVDGVEMFKAVIGRVEKNETSVLAGMRAMVDIVKSLGDQVKKLSESGRGRKAVLTIAEKAPAATDVTKSAEEGVKPDDFFAKALAMQAEGKLSGTDIARAESYMNRGLPVPAEIVQRVLGGK